MTDFPSLLSKVNALKAKVEPNSITPTYLGSLLEDFVNQMIALDMTGMSDDVQAAVRDATTALSTARSALQQAGSAETTASSATANALTALGQAAQALTSASNAETMAARAETTANSADSRVSSLENKIGAPGGLAPLDGAAKVPLANLPDAVINAMEFNCRVDDVPTMAAGAAKTSTDTGCLVVFDTAKNTFLLAVVDDSFGITADQWQQLTDAFRAYGANAPSLGPVDVSDLWEFDDNNECVGLISVNFNFYTVWGDAARYGVPTSNGYAPMAGKRYFCAADGITYKWDGSCLTDADISLGTTPGTAFPGDVGAEMRTVVMSLSESHNSLRNEVTTLTREGARFINLNTLAEHFAPYSSLKEALKIVPGDRRGFGTVVRVYLAKTDSKGQPLYVWETYQWIKTAADKDYNWEDPSEWEPFGSAGSADGNCLNVTVEIPKTNTTNPYYDIASAIEAVFSKGRAKLGLQITFASTAKTWKQYQYIGSTLNTEDFCNEMNWIDMAGTSAGTEPFINVNDLCGEGALQYGAYTLESAIKAIADKETETGITYRKAGMVITYKVGDGKWETKQLVQTVNSFNIPGAWDPFGSAKGNDVKTSDKPVKDGKDAFSTGGAYSAIPRFHDVTQEDGTVSIQFYADEAHQEAIMDPIEFLASQGGTGDSSGTIVSIAFQKAPLYAALGSSLSTKAAIRSVTTVGNVETDNSIEKLELIDKDTKAVVWTANVNKASSPSMISFTFDLDFSSFFTVAGQKTFTLVATDDTGKTGRKNITVIAEDLTLTCTQRLSETIAPTDTQAYVEMYAFYNNQSESGIRCNVDILINEEWVNIHQDIVTNAFSRPVMFNAAALGLTHGAYQLRMQGESVDSGVKGNTVYTTILCVDPSVTDGTLIALRYDDNANGTIRLFDTISLDVAAWRKVNGTESSALVDMYIADTKITQIKVDPERVVNFRKQISGYKQGDILIIRGTYGSVVSPEIHLRVDGSVLDISLKAGPALDLDFASRSNNEADHTISDQGYTMSVIGANWTTNGFVEYLGINALRIAENVKASIPYAPFGASTIEQTGAVVQMKIATRNIRDKEAKLIECYDPDSGVGFYICGNKAVMYCKNGTDGNSKNYHETPLENDKVHTVAFVVEPATIYKERDGVKYSALKLYVDGSQEGMFAYIPGSGSVLSNQTISFDGSDGDLYLYYILCYRSHYEWAQAFDNYLVKGTDTEAMVEEYNAENVAVSQTAEGTTAMRPSAAALWARKIRYMVNIDTESGFSVFDFGNGSEDNGFTTSPKFKNLTQVFNDPVRPWRSFKAVNVTKKRQGTTSTLRCVKNEDDDYTKAVITPLYSEYQTDAALRATLTAEELEDITNTFALFEMGYIRIGDNSMPIQRAMNKVDFSDSSCANNGGVCDMMNDTFRSMGPAYLTPSQRFYDGTWDKGNVHLRGIQLNHSIANFPCAIFRSTSETMQNVYFHARGSYMESKKEQRALGFRDVPGYNKGCLNYGDFKELFCAPGQTLAQYVAAADKTTWEYTNDDGDVFNVIVISEYCGRGFKVFRRANTSAAWVDTTGSMRQVGGKWTVTGDVLNPVTGFELLNYTGICWWMGIATVNDMMAPTKSMSSWVEKLKLGADSYPYWTQFFECMIEDDQLAIDYAMGRKVPYELFNTLRFMNTVDYSQAALTATWKPRWKSEAWQFMSMESVMVYHVFTDYLAAVDQRAKNMQPMWFLEDGCYIDNGQFYGINGMEPCRMYLNKVYDCDTCNGQDNEGGKTVDPEVDPDKPTDEAEGYTNPYAGWGSILFNNIARCKEEQIVCGAADEHGVLPTLTLTSVAQNMRSKQTTLPDGRTITPFSPEGARYYFIEQRINKWPKKVSTYDCERKYIDRTAKANKIYFYAHQGSGRTGLNRFIDVRWLVRDGFYQTGGFFSDPLVMRINCRSNAKIRITAAARGYFAVGYENIGQISGEPVFLEAGESYEFTEFSKVDGTQLYIYQTARMSKLDLSDLSISGANFSRCVLLEELILGSATHENVLLGSYPIQTDLQLGNLPFLHTIDLRNTMIKSLNCSGCPRMAHIKAEGSQLQTMTLAQTSPINDISLPDTMTEFRFIGLPNLTYAGLSSDGLRVAALANVQKLRLESSPRIDAVRLMNNIITAMGTALRSVRIAEQNLKGDASELQAIIAKGIKGMNDQGEENRPCPVIIGTYELTRLLEQSEIDDIETNIEGITLFTAIEAFISLIDQLNGEYFSGDSEVATATLDNIGEHIIYYNGETFEEYAQRMNEADRSIHEIIHE
ncbi:MAG: hypothetical protein HDS60_03820 [Barnesiella sp.]|nr:hypothetical protein [Barnesiella sp.]